MLLEIVGWAGSVLLVVSVLQTRVMRFRVLNAGASAVLLGYNAAIEVWPMVGMNLVLVGINIWVITGMLRRRHDSRAYDVVPVGVDEPYLAHVLTRHAAEPAASAAIRATTNTSAICTATAWNSASRRPNCRRSRM